MPATCERYAAGLYEQALLTPGDPVLAEQIFGDVLLNECALAAAPGRGEDGARYRLAKPVFRRCQPLARRGGSAAPGSGLPGALPAA